MKISSFVEGRYVCATEVVARCISGLEYADMHPSIACSTFHANRCNTIYYNEVNKRGKVQSERTRTKIMD